MEKKDYLIVLDTETTNSLEEPLCYDVGFAVVDTEGNVFERYSFVVKEIFFDENLMNFAYFSDKIPQYFSDILNCKRSVKTFLEIRRILMDCIYRYNILVISAHNAVFDKLSLTLTLKYITKSKMRYFFPKRVEIWDTLKMSREVLNKSEEYKDFCVKNEYLTKTGCKKFTAEVVFRFLTNNVEFVESHTGLEDVLIEKDIFAFCFLKNPDIDGILGKRA